MSSTDNEYNILGKTNKKFFVKVYKPNKNLIITDFRMMFYKYIESIFGKPIIKNKVDSSGNLYYLLEPLFAVPDFNYGKGNWSPHISIINTNDLYKYKRQQLNENIYQY